MTEPTDAQIEAFKTAWHEADSRDESGSRVRAGLRAAFAVRDAVAAEAVPLTREEEIAFRKAYDASVVPSPHNGGERAPGSFTSIIGSRARRAQIEGPA